jgi:hypothetical protein
MNWASVAISWIIGFSMVVVPCVRTSQLYPHDRPQQSPCSMGVSAIALAKWA